MISTSSYDRGLIYTLKNWPRIIKEFPKAEFHIFYGWNLFDKFHHNNPERMSWKAKVVKLMEQDGIFEHGRVGHDELHKELATSDIFLYPCAFEEISCISAQKSQALGAIPFVTDYAALTETVKNGVKVDVDITDPDGQVEFFDELIKFMKDDEKREEMRPQMMKFAQDYFLWSKVAETWSNIFGEKVNDSIDNFEKGNDAK